MPQRRQSLSTLYPSALVTGASSGLGKAIASMLLEEGLQVHGTTRDPGQPNLNPDVIWHLFEGSVKENVTDWISANGDLLSNIDILVNNCGSGIFGDAPSVDSRSEEALQQLMLGTPVALTKVALKGMRGRGGAIVNVSSLAAQFPLPYMAGYTAIKAGLSAYTQSLLLTEPGSGVVLIDFQAGDFRTSFNKNMVKAENPGRQEVLVWAQIEKLMSAAPSPDRGAKDLLRTLLRGKSSVLRSGGFFQTRIAPLGIRCLPRKWLLGSIRWYYRLGNK